MNILASSTPRFKRMLANALSALAILAIALANTGSVVRASEPSPLQGWHDGMSGTVDPGSCAAFGWAVDPLNTDLDLSIRVLSDGVQVAVGIANEPGTDMEQLGICPNGTCRFSVPLPDTQVDRVRHEITVQASDPGTDQWWNLEGTPKSLTCSPVLPSIRGSISNNYLRANDFAPDTLLTFSVYSAYPPPPGEEPWMATRKTDSNGFVFIWPEEGVPNLVPGNYLMATNGNEEKDLVLEDVRIDSFDTVTRSVTGTAPAGRGVWVWAGNEVDPGCAMGAVADPVKGAWSATFPADSCQLKWNMWAAVEMADQDWDASVYEKGPDPAVFTVNTTDDNDDGTCDASHCSLREAINVANVHIATDTIAFDIPGDAPFTIQPGSPLPEITDPVIIDGTTQPGFAGLPIVELDGSMTEYADGLVISAGNSTVRGLVVNRWQNVGILLLGSYETGTGGNLIEGNYLGTDITGSSAAGNNIGVYAILSSGNTIRGNLLSGNTGVGVGIRGFAVENVVSGNRIGTSADGMSAVPNRIGVVLEESATGNTVGGTSEEDRNIISGNGEDGVWIKDIDTNDNVVQGNYIGTDSTGAAALPNGVRGVYIFGAVKDNLIAGNLISGNGAAGIRINDQDTTGNKVQGNYIGTDLTGTLPLGNGFVGVRIAGGATGNVIGGIGAGNVISANMAEGILIDEGSSDNRVQGNYIGTDRTGINALGNASVGIFIAGGATENVIGGSQPGERNIISGNYSDGVGIVNAGTENNRIQGNYIGTDINGTAAVPNAAVGVSISDGASHNLVGPGNVISGNGQPGIAINGGASTGNTVQGNTVGADISGTAALPNNGMGIWVGDGAQNTLIGGTGAGEGNLISGNFGQGIGLNDLQVTGTRVQGNYIGTDKTGTSALPNGAGVSVLGTGNWIGGTEPGAGNVISANGWVGIEVSGGASGNFVQGNFIGTDKTGTRIFSATAPPVVHYDVSVDAACSTYPAGTDFDGFISQSDDPLAPWSGTSVTFKGTDECPGAETYNASSLVYRYRIDFDEITQLQSIAVTGAAFNGPDNVLRVLDKDRNELAVAWTNGGNSLRTNYLFLQGVSGQTFYLEEYDTSTTWRLRESIVVNGPLPLGNHAAGVFLGSGATNNLIGGADAAARNIISGNLENGLILYDAGTTANTVEGNFIGTDVSGTLALGNGGSGVGINNGASGNLIGDIGAGNLISGNSDGVTIADPGTDGNIVRGNKVGTDASGTVALPNPGAGVWVGGGPSDTMIGGADAGAGNLISGNGTHGVSINWPDTTGTRVLGNYIGTDAAGTNAVTNGAGGVYVSSPETWIGEPGAGNVISGNDGLAIYFGGAEEQGAAYGDFIQGNLIGTDTSGTKPLPNGGGIYLATGVHDTMIGGTQPGAGNVIANNLWVGIGTTPDAGLSNAFLSNSIFSNGSLGIDLAGDGVTLNDARDRDTGPNNLQNFPVLSRPKIVDGQLRLAGNIFSKPNTTYRLEFFSVPACDDSGYGEGQLYLGSGQVTTGAGGSADFSFLLPNKLLAGWLVTSTATDPDGNTSEFSQCSDPLK